MQRCAELFTTNIFIVISKNVINSFLVVFCCKVGVYYAFKCEISYQSWCRDKYKNLVSVYIPPLLH